MKIVIKILDILGVFLASLLVPVLFTLLMLSPFVSSVVSVANPEKLGETVTSIDYTQVINASDTLKEAIGEMGYDAETVNEFMQSDAVGDVVELYAKDISDMLSGTYTESSLTSDAIGRIVNENMDELITIARDVFDEAKGATDEELKAVINDAVTENLDTLVQSLPKVDALSEEITSSLGADIDMQTVSAVYTFTSQQLITVLHLAIAAIAILILLLRIYRIKGLMWLGVIFTVGGIVDFVMLLGVQSLVDIVTEQILPAEMSSMIAVLPDMLRNAILPYATAYTVIGVVLIAAFILLRILYKTLRAAKSVSAASVAAAAGEAYADANVSNTDSMLYTDGSANADTESGAALSSETSDIPTVTDSSDNN